MGGVRLAGCGRGFTGQLRFGGADRVRLSPRDSERDLLLPPSYRGGQLVVEYANRMFSQPGGLRAR
jgi:hypothetical protein